MLISGIINKLNSPERECICEQYEKYSHYNDLRDDFEPDFEFEEYCFKVLNSLVSIDLNEDFKNAKHLKSHYNKHCMGMQKKSRNAVRYNFTSLEDYKDYENYIRNLPVDGVISDLSDKEYVLKQISTLLEGDYALLINSESGYADGEVSILLHSFCDDAAVNCSKNCIDFCVIEDYTGYTKTLYPVLAKVIRSRFLKNSEDFVV